VVTPTGTGVGAGAGARSGHVIYTED